MLKLQECWFTHFYSQTLQFGGLFWLLYTDSKASHTKTVHCLLSVLYTAVIITSDMQGMVWGEPELTMCEYRYEMLQSKEKAEKGAAGRTE